MNRLHRVAAVLALALLASGCGKGAQSTAPDTRRTYVMGFTGIPPKPDLAVAIQSIDLWAQRADAALVLHEPPWDSLFAGTRADSLVMRSDLPLVGYYRSKGLRVIVSIDPTNGLDRSSDSAPLVAVGRSLTEPAIRQLYRDYVVAVDTLLRPDDLGVASETNLIRAVAPAPLYAALVQAAASAAGAVRAADPAVKLFSTVQVETAWGRLPPAGGYVGIAQDRADFPFAQILGLSSYPYLGGFAEPESLPSNYYSRLVEGAPLPVMVIEGGWSSDTAATVPSTPDRQRRYITRHARLLDAAQAVGWFQITFTDLDLGYFPPSIEPFAYLGLVDANLMPKPALSAWDAEFARGKH
jgi:hypothetical protein